MLWFTERKKDTEYWSNPQVYINDHDSPDISGPHFILHDFKVKDSLSLDAKPKRLSIMGQLKYKVSLNTI